MNIYEEHLLSFREAARLLPSSHSNKTVHISTLHRWSTHGIRGVRLETIKVGGARKTSREAIQRFVEALSASDSNAQRSPRRRDAPAQEDAHQAEVNRRLDEEAI